MRKENFNKFEKIKKLNIKIMLIRKQMRLLANQINHAEDYNEAMRYIGTH